MTTPTKYADQLKILDELERHIVELRERWRSFREQAKIYAEKRDALDGQSKKIWEEVKELKARRNELNETIKKMKEERNQLHQQVANKREELRSLRKKMDELPGEGNTHFMARRIEELDWEIQTNPLSLAEEKELIGRIKILEERMLASKEAIALKERLLELRSEFGALRIAANDVHEKIVELAAHSQETHEKMISKIKESETVKPEADEAYQMYRELLSQADEAHRGYIEAMARSRAIRLQMQQDREEEVKRRVEAAISIGSEQALRKLKERRKMTLEEFKILKSKGLI